MSFVGQHGGPSTDPPELRYKGRSPFRSSPKRSVGTAIAAVFTVFAFIVVACSGDNGASNGSDQPGLDEQGQPICNPDDGCGPPPRDPCGHDGEACCRFNNSCQSPLVCYYGTCTQCGVAGGPCCNGTTCGANLSCQNGQCNRICGAQGLACCTSGPACDGGLACSGGTCQSCGRSGQVCCDGNSCTQSGAQCIGGTCKLCGGNGQACCTSGAACGTYLSCQNSTCKPNCGTAYGTCCPSGFDWDKCPFAGAGYACDPTFNQCKPCGAIGGPCCASTFGLSCNFSNEVCVASPFGGGTCKHCGYSGEPCCTSGTACMSGFTCSSGTCR